MPVAEDEERGPIRTCIVTRAERPPEELIRFVLAPDGTARRFTGDSAALARAVMEFYSRPRTRDELLRHLARAAACEQRRGENAAQDAASAGTCRYDGRERAWSVHLDHGNGT